MKRAILNLASVAGLCAFAFMFYASGKSTKEKGSSSQEEVSSTSFKYELESRELSAIYDENEVAADNKLKGEVIKLTGKIQSIDKDFSDNSVVILAGKNMMMGVHCEMKYEEDAAKVKKGQTIILIGKCKGAILGSVGLESCIIAE